jgi:twitching motility protein PilT
VEINELLRFTVEKGASDLHLKVGNVPFVRVDGELQPTQFPTLAPSDTEGFAQVLMSDHKKREFEQHSEADLGYTLAGVGRFRVNVFRQRGVVGLAIRRVRSESPTFEELRLPHVMRVLADSPRGLVLITGPTGTGKTTTIASMIGHINSTRRCHVVTIEDPIEVVHDDALSIIQQREIGIDTDSYANALRHVIRQDPDVIFIGEIRDPESALSAIQAAETGHLVISTFRTIDCVETINRILDLFPPQQQREVRTSFAGSLRGIVSQRLVPRADGKGRVPAVWVLAGDLNCTPDSPEVMKIQRVNLIDLNPDKGSGTKTSGLRAEPTITVDYIFAGPKYVALNPYITEQKIRNNPKPLARVTVSDHVPLYAELPILVPVPE